MVDLRVGNNMPPVYDQGDLGSCTANAIAAAFDFQFYREKAAFLTPSRLFIYANERLLEGTPLSDDSGAEIRDGMKVVAQQGVCPETEWPYDELAFSVMPPSACYNDALKEVALQYRAVHQGQDTRIALSEGLPVIAGFTVYESFESPEVAATGVVNLPTSSESVVGGHAIMIVGYDLTTSRYTVRNSWGMWGQSGYFTVPFAYFDDPNYASDFWVFQKVS